MAQHTRRSGDKAYRRVSLFARDTGAFEPFQTAGESVRYNEDEQVLEIKTEDGTVECFTGNRVPVDIYYGVTGKQVWLSYAQEPGLAIRCAARLWLRSASGTGVEYKVPSDLKLEGGTCRFDVPGGTTADIELVGDKYFDMAFRLVRS